MTATRLTDVIVPSVFNPYMMKETTTKSEIFEAGIMRQDGNLAKFLSGGGQTVNVPFWKDLTDDTDANVSSDDPAAESTPDKIGTGKDIAIRCNRNKSWSSVDLVSELAGDDPMQAIGARVATWWRRHFQRVLVATIKGVIADNVANDSGDMVNDISLDTSATTTAAELISAEAILDTAQTMGDASSVLDTIIMHSVVYNRLAKLNLIDFIPNSDGSVRFASYLGYRVVKDDGCPAVAGSNRTIYQTYLVGKEAFGWAEVPPMVPVETERKPAQGNGGGAEILYTRRQYVLHPYGVKFTSTSLAGESPTNTELATATNWDRVYAERKQIPLAVLKTNG